MRIGNPVFGECFVCGIRPEGDGLGIYAGLVAGREPVHAAPWDATETGAGDRVGRDRLPGRVRRRRGGERRLVLGRMTARIRSRARRRRGCVVASWPLGEDGRKLFAGTALFAEDGELLALARQTWITPR